MLDPQTETVFKYGVESTRLPGLSIAQSLSVTRLAFVVFYRVKDLVIVSFGLRASPIPGQHAQQPDDGTVPTEV